MKEWGCEEAEGYSEYQKTKALGLSSPGEIPDAPLIGSGMPTDKFPHLSTSQLLYP